LARMKNVVIVSVFLFVTSHAMNISSFDFSATVQPGIVNFGDSQLKVQCNPQKSCSKKAVTKSHCIRLGCCWNNRKCVSNDVFFLKFCPNGKCECKWTKDNEIHVNLVFALDGSGSVNDDEFIQQKNFIKDTIDGLQIERYSVGLLQYSSDAWVEFNMWSGKTKDQLKSQVDNVVQDPGSTMLAYAVYLGADMLDWEKDYYEDGKVYRNVFVYITDGTASHYDIYTQKSLDYMDNLVPGTTRFAVGIDGADYDELKTVATSVGNVAFSREFDDLPNFPAALSANLNNVGCPGS